MAVILEPCTAPAAFQVNGCKDYAVIDLGNVEMTSLGRVVDLNTVIKNVCPGKRVAVAVELNEVDNLGNEAPRGLKVFTIPAQQGSTCLDVELKCIKFILPEDISLSGGTPSSMCSARHFNARVMANYIDTDFVCCGETTV